MWSEPNVFRAEDSKAWRPGAAQAMKHKALILLM